MNTEKDNHYFLDSIKLLFLIGSLIGSILIFSMSSILFYPGILALITSTLISPWVSRLERQGLTRSTAISIVFGGILILFFISSYWGIQSFADEWDSIQVHAPLQFKAAIAQLRSLEASLKSNYPFLRSIHPTDKILTWGEDLGKWILTHGSALAGSFLSLLIITPAFTFVLLNEGHQIRRGIYQLIPNRFFESFYLIYHQISISISDYVRAKLIEGFLVGLMITLGLTILGAPYSLALGVFAGVTNIIPYLGPFIGLIPAGMMIASDPGNYSLLGPTALIFLAANIIDTIILFPLIVAKLVNLHFIILIFAVTLGQSYYGLVGMLFSIPITTTIKIILQNIYKTVYERHAIKLNAIPLPMHPKTRKFKRRSKFGPKHQSE